MPQIRPESGNREALLPVEELSPAQVRRFAWLAALALAMVAGRLEAPRDVMVRLAAALVFTLGTVWPTSQRRVYIALSVLTRPVGWLMSRVLLTGVWIFLIVPLGLIFRLSGRDPLQRRFQQEALSYWEPRKHRQEPAQYQRQF